MGKLEANNTQLLLQSFGFKYGLPAEADFIFDVRCLPNPYWEPQLKTLTGLDSEVCRYFADLPKVQQMLDDITNFVKKWVPAFQTNDRSNITLAIGCTGGQHRSVYMIESLSKKIVSSIDNISVSHRELMAKKV